MNKLSEQLQQDHECGDFGKALDGYSERAKLLEDEIAELNAAVELSAGVIAKYEEGTGVSILDQVLSEMSESESDELS